MIIETAWNVIFFFFICTPGRYLNQGISLTSACIYARRTPRSPPEFPQSFPRTMEDHMYPHSTGTAPPGGDPTELELGGTFIDAPAPGELRIRRDTWVRIDLTSGTILDISTSQAGPSRGERLSIKMPPEMVVVPGFIDCVCISSGGLGIRHRLIGWW
jgi:hypothetical protein